MLTQIKISVKNEDAHWEFCLQNNHIKFSYTLSGFVHFENVGFCHFSKTSIQNFGVKIQKFGYPR